MSLQALFSLFKSSKTRNSRRHKVQPGAAVTSVQSLENRQLMTAVATLNNDTLEIQGTSGNDEVEVQYAGRRSRYIKVSSRLGYSTSTKYFRTSDVKSIKFDAGNGDDTFTNKTWKPSTVMGGAGNDTLTGGYSKDRLYGQDGDDKLYGRRGNDILSGGNNEDFLDGGSGDDTLLGGNHNDTLLGGSGTDRLLGGRNDDHLNGQSGIDYLWGEHGNDVLIAIDNDTGDYLNSGTGKDVLWVDKSGRSKDSMYRNSSADKVQAVSSFKNGADKTLNGDSIKGPVGGNLSLGRIRGQSSQRFIGNPLFAKSGPSQEDVRQGYAGTCYFLAGVSAIAEDNPHVLKQNIVDFNDGTYGVRMGNSFYRVDNRLRTETRRLIPSYAQLGRENSMWVAIAEKAWAHHRKGKNSYSSIEGGLSVEAYKAFGVKNTSHKDFSQFRNATSLANYISNRWNNYEFATVGFVSSNGKKKASNSKLVMGHMYSVSSVHQDSRGRVTSIVLRNPWGYDGGKTASGSSSDGLITLTPSELWNLRSVGIVNSGRS